MRRCGECQFCLNRTQATRDQQIAECHRYPPTGVLRLDGTTAWPLVDPESPGCGEWQGVQSSVEVPEPMDVQVDNLHEH